MIGFVSDPDCDPYLVRAVCRVPRSRAHRRGPADPVPVCRHIYCWRSYLLFSLSPLQALYNRQVLFWCDLNLICYIELIHLILPLCWPVNNNVISDCKLTDVGFDYSTSMLLINLFI